MAETNAGWGLSGTGLTRAGRVASAVLVAALFAGCASFPEERVPSRAPDAPDSGVGPELPPERPPAPTEVRPDAPRPVLRPVPIPTPEPAAPPSYHAAGEALVEQARREADLGNAALAGATLERALRIDGNNPWIWIELGHLRLEAGQRPAAESMARKALSLANRDPLARDAAAQLLQQASGR